MRLPRLSCFAASLGAVASAAAASFDARVEALFRPPLGEMIALAPDGQRVAYTTPAGAEVAIVIMNLEQPGPKRTIKLEPDRDSAVAQAAPPVQLRFLRWATASRLVFAPTERIVPLPPLVDKRGRATPNPDGPTIISPVLMMDVDGKQRGKLVDARDFMETPADARRSLADFLRTTKEIVASRNEPVRWRMPHIDIVGFLPRDREQLVIQTRGAYSMPMQHLVDIRTGSVSEFGGEWPSPPGEPQVFDWFRLKVVGERKEAARPATAWRDEELARMQGELELKFPRRTVELLDWSETRTRVLFRVTGGRDPGRIFVYQRPEDLVLEILRRAPWLTAARVHETRFFECDAPDGARLSGYLTWPGKPPRTPPPLLVMFPSGFPGRPQPAFDPEAQVFADLGFAVARLNHRCVAGLRPADLTALRSAVDRVSIDDARVALDWIAAKNPDRPFDRRRIASLGRGFGGYLAIRALQLEPMMFRCGIGIDAPMELQSWVRSQAPGTANSKDAIPAALIDHDAADWKKLSIVDQAPALAQPVLVMLEARRNPAIDRSTAELRARLEGLGRTMEPVELEPGFAAALPKSRATVYRKIQEFLALHAQDHAVKIGQVTEVK